VLKALRFVPNLSGFQNPTGFYRLQNEGRKSYFVDAVIKSYVKSIEVRSKPVGFSKPDRFLSTLLTKKKRIPPKRNPLP
jgi:hypothetical protein